MLITRENESISAVTDAGAYGRLAEGSVLQSFWSGEHDTITPISRTANNAIITGDITANSLILKPTSTTIEKSSDQYAFDTYIEDNLLTKNKIVYIDKIGKRKFENIEVSGVKTGVK